MPFLVALKEATAEATRANNSLALIHEMLSTSSPQSTKGAQYTVREMLFVLGKALLGLGNPEAETCFVRSLDCFQRNGLQWGIEKVRGQARSYPVLYESFGQDD